jgi:serine/threonine-protein kinase
VQGSAAGEAQQALSDAGFGVSVTEAESSADQEGLVTDQDPSGGESVDLGSEVEITVGAGPAPVEVPNLYGYTLDEAAAELESLGLALGGSDTAPSNEMEEGGIIFQSVEAGASVESGTEIGVTVSSGPELVTVPDVTGQDVSSAQQTIAAAGFDVETIEVQNSGWTTGTVLYTDPPAGAALEPGSTVAIAYSSGPAQTQPETQPEDDGDDNEEARQDRQDRRDALREARQAREEAQREAREARREAQREAQREARESNDNDG